MNLYQVDYAVTYETNTADGWREKTATAQADVRAETYFDARERLAEREDRRYGLRLVEVRITHIERIA